MADAPEKTVAEARVAGLVAEFASAQSLRRAAAGVRQEGFTHWDVHSPFPIHGMQRVMGFRSTRLPWLVLVGGLAGGTIALLMQWWMNAVDHPHLVSGKPLFSLPANIPITFELIVLVAALAAFGGTMALGRLPQFLHFVFRARRFARVTTDGFFISIAAGDPKFDASTTPQWMESLGATEVEVCYEPAGRDRLPAMLRWGLVVVAVVALLPPLLVTLARERKSDRPRFDLIQDMDFQPKYKPQSASGLFSDGRAMRPPVAGTIAWGDLQADDHFCLGYHAAPQGQGEEQREYFSTLPPQLRPRMRELMDRGQQRFNIYCATCHGLLGDGHGMTSLRALQRQDPDWQVPTSLHVSSVRQQPLGRLFGTITGGHNKMPAYGSQIPIEDRWAIVLYVRALERSQNASIEDVPAEIRPQLR
jgi:mono/diheme cytochrome c family protein